MPTPTTAEALKVAFIAAINAIQPRTERASSVPWKYYAQRTGPKQGMRWYTLRLEIVGITEGGLFGQNAYSVDALLSVIADYGTVPEHELDSLGSDDFLQLHDILNTVRGSIDGLKSLRLGGWEPVDGELTDGAQVIHQYELIFLKSRATNAS